MSNKNLRCNEQIRLSPIRLIDEQGTLHGVVPTDEALRRAREAGLDLVEVSPTERPPVCKIMDYGKFKYSQSKQKQKHHEQKLKEVRLRPRTDPHDRMIKVEHAKEFLAHGDRVQFTMVFRGRERQHREIGEQTLSAIIQDLDGIAKVERPPRMEGGRMSMVLVPTKIAPVKPPPKKPKAPRAPGEGKPAEAAAAPAPMREASA
ncbi:MAG: translation initiation factor IF-3 [Phycisphaerae bacterium]